jgi:acyl-CoA thioesterase-1
MMSLLIHGAILTPGCASQAKVVEPTKPESMAVMVRAGEYLVMGKRAVVNYDQRLEISPRTIVKVAGEKHALSDEKPFAWHSGTLLKKTCSSLEPTTRMPKVLVPDSVRVRSATGDIFYEADKDFYLDSHWGGMSRIDGGAIAKGQEVLIDYAVYQRRIDLVQIDATGKARVKPGKPVDACPEAPKPDKDCVPLATVYISPRTSVVTSEVINSFPRDETKWKDFVKTSGGEHIRKTIAKLKAGKDVTVVCWGDSVTQGAGPSSPDKCYVGLLRSRLTAAYPRARINVVNAGIGASNTDSRRDGYEKEVLSFKPDLITVEFVNDCSFPPKKLLANWAEFTARARAANPDVEFIFITPHFVMAEWMNSWNKAVPAMRKAAEINKAALADAANVWANLQNIGIPYEALLVNGINHPNDLGHEFFAESIMRLLAN